jgi:hypothetical protein
MDLINKLNNINIKQNTRMCSFDITNIYTNIHLNAITNIIRSILSKEEIPQSIIYETDRITKLIIEQNYFQHNKLFYKQKEGLAIGAPSSSILSELFLQFLEHNEILIIWSGRKIISYARYVDDILIIYDHNNTNLNKVLNQFNNIHSNIQFTVEKKTLAKLIFWTSQYTDWNQALNTKFVENRRALYRYSQYIVPPSRA